MNTAYRHMIKSLISRIKILGWKLTRGQIIHFKYWRTKKERRRIVNVLSSIETVDYIIRKKCSIARYGDGEFQLIEHLKSGGDDSSFKVSTFQTFNKELANKLLEVLFNPTDNLLVCIPYPLIHSKAYRKYEKIFFEREWLIHNQLVKEAVGRHSVLGDAAFTRFYMHRNDIPDFEDYIRYLMTIWRGESVILVEGEKSRLGVGNDLFDNVTEIKRILCPSVDAFSAYSRILSAIENLNRKDCLYLLALGQTATVLAHDLAIKGFRAIDLGHLDVEYEWYRIGAKEKCALPDKYVNEVAEGRIVDNPFSDLDYESQILARIK